MKLNLKESNEIIDHFLNLQSPQELADLLHVDFKYLKYYLYIIPESKRYQTFLVSKKIGVNLGRYPHPHLILK